jgi:hypothetical protein
VCTSIGSSTGVYLAYAESTSAERKRIKGAGPKKQGRENEKEQR